MRYGKAPERGQSRVDPGTWFTLWPDYILYASSPGLRATEARKRYFWELDRFIIVGPRRTRDKADSITAIGPRKL